MLVSLKPISNNKFVSFEATKVLDGFELLLFFSAGLKPSMPYQLVGGIFVVLESDSLVVKGK